MSFVKLDDKHCPDSTEVFLDTSVHCCFLKGDTLRPRLNWLLGLFSWKGTSTYSKVEYGNVILATAQYYLRMLRELGSVARVHEHIAHVLRPQHREKRTWAFSLIQTLGKTEEERTRRAEASLRRLLKLGTIAVDAHCDAPLADGTRCHWGKQGSIVDAMENTPGKLRTASLPIGRVMSMGFLLIAVKRLSWSRRRSTAWTPICSPTNLDSFRESSASA